MNIKDLFEDFDTHEELIGLDVIESKLKSLSVSLDEVANSISFGSKTYRRNLLHKGPQYHALVLCWRAGQRSPIHDHHGSSCGVRVLQGTLIETTFERTEAGHIYASASSTLSVGNICCSKDSDVHQVSNLQAAGEDLITLHLYSPPLLSMNTYSLTGTEVKKYVEPIFGYSDGGGI